MTTETPIFLINPVILKWARETAGLSIEDVVKRLARKRIDAKIIAAWEEGSEAPTYFQLERLAYEIYKRPLALFFFPHPPEEPSPKQSFRTLPSAEIEKFAPRMHQLIKLGRVMQVNLSELFDGKNPVSNSKLILKNFRFEASDTIDSMIKETRTFLSITLDDQISWHNTDEAFKQWRVAFENVGIYVFKDAFKVDEFSGFCLYDQEFPIIYVNNSKAQARQIFTLFHELAHLLFHTGGVDTRLDNYINYLKGDAKKIEIKCNLFAAHFLVPENDFIKQITNQKVNESLIEDLAERYHVSREVILRRFLDKKLVSSSVYERFVKKWKEEATGNQGTGGNYYRNIGAYLGRRYLELVFGRYHQGKITTEQLADYLGVKTKSVAGIESILMS